MERKLERCSGCNEDCDECEGHQDVLDTNAIQNTSHVDEKDEEIKRLKEELKQTKASVMHWKANHADVIRKYRKQRDVYGDALLMIRRLEAQLKKP